MTGVYHYSGYAPGWYGPPHVTHGLIFHSPRFLLAHLPPRVPTRPARSCANVAIIVEAFFLPTALSDNKTMSHV